MMTSLLDVLCFGCLGVGLLCCSSNNDNVIYDFDEKVPQEVSNKQQEEEECALLESQSAKRRRDVSLSGTTNKYGSQSLTVKTSRIVTTRTTTGQLFTINQTPMSEVSAAEDYIEEDEENYNEESEYTAMTCNSYVSPFDLSSEVEYKHYKTFGGYGVENGQFNNPCGVALDAQGQLIYVCDYLNHRIQVFNYEGEFLHKFGSFGSAEKEFKFPYGIVVDDDGRLLISDARNSRVQVLNCATCKPYFEAQPSLDSEVNTLYGIAVNSQRDIYVCDLNNHQVQVFDTSGNFKFKFGHYGEEEGCFDIPCSVAINKLDHVYVSDYRNHRIQVFNSRGDFFFSFGREGSSDSHFRSPSGLSLDKYGNLYVCDESNHRIQVFDSTGEFIGKLGSGKGNKVGQFNHPCGIAVASDGSRVIVSDTKNHRIQIFQMVPRASPANP